MAISTPIKVGLGILVLAVIVVIAFFVNKAISERAAELEMAAPAMAAPEMVAPEMVAPEMAVPGIAAPDIATPDMATPDMATVPGPECTAATILTESQILSLAKDFHDSVGKAIMSPLAPPFIEVDNSDEKTIHIRFTFVSVNGGEGGEDSRIFMYKFNFETCKWEVIAMGAKNSGTLAIMQKLEQDLALEQQRILTQRLGLNF